MLSKKMEDALGTIEALKEKGHPLVYVGDVVGTGSSRKSATNSVLWHMGDDIPHIPNKRDGGFVLGGKIAPIFFNTMEDAGARQSNVMSPKCPWVMSSHCILMMG